MVKVMDVMAVMEKIAPKRLAESWDNPGLLVGNPESNVNKILVALDANERVVDEAVKIGAELIVTHHPIIFKPLKSIRSDLASGKKLYNLIRHNISVFSAHTNLDSAEDGVNDILAKKLNLTDIKPLTTNENGEPRLGRIGKLEKEISLENFAGLVKNNLNLSHIRLVRGKANKIKKVALCGGAGAEFIDRAAFLGADAFITGDVKYHEAERANSLGITLIDAGHFGTEYIVVKPLAEKLRENFSDMKKDVKIIEDSDSVDVFVTV